MQQKKKVTNKHGDVIVLRKKKKVGKSTALEYTDFSRPVKHGTEMDKSECLFGCIHTEEKNTFF